MKSFFGEARLIGRHDELEQVLEIFDGAGNLVITGVPGIGRRQLIHAAAQRLGLKVLEVDCLRATSARQFLQLFSRACSLSFVNSVETGQLQRWLRGKPVALEALVSGTFQLSWPPHCSDEWSVFEVLLALPQQMAEWLNSQAVVVFQNFPHLRTWDRQGKWEQRLCAELQRQDRINFVLISTVAEPYFIENEFHVIALPPLTHGELHPWLVEGMAAANLVFDPASKALELFLDYVQGNIRDAIALARRLQLEHLALDPKGQDGIIRAYHVHSSMVALIEDLSVTFESLLLLLPNTQRRVLESLALDPTSAPQARAYIRKHQLSRGGGLQAALNALEQKGLIYGTEYDYRVALPFLDFWLKQRLR